jgi:hypothetical protein
VEGVALACGRLRFAVGAEAVWQPINAAKASERSQIRAVDMQRTLLKEAACDKDELFLKSAL